MAEINEDINAFVNFIVEKLKNFKILSIGEQVSYSTIVTGLILILVSLILFIL